MRPFYSFILHHPIVIVTFRLLVHLLLNSFVFSPSRTRPMAISSFFLILIWAFPLVWLWPMKAYTIFLIQLIAFLVRVPIWSVCGWFPKLHRTYFHSLQISLFQYPNFGVIVIFVFYHISHFLQFFFCSLWFLCPDSYITLLVPKSDSSISDFFALYLFFSDLLLLDACDFWFNTHLHPFRKKI